MTKNSKAKEHALTLGILHAILRYDAMTGVFVWLIDRPHAPALSEAGCVRSKYHRISIDHRKYLTHRLAWFYVYGVWPSGQIDHRNGNRLDNRLENLRVANFSTNQANIGVKPNKKTPWPKGVSYETSRGKWRAGIKVRGKSYNLGYHGTPELAHAAYIVAARGHFGEFARSV